MMRRAGTPKTWVGEMAGTELRALLKRRLSSGRCPGVEHGPNLTTCPGLPASVVPSAFRLTGLVMTIYQHIRHPHIAARRADRPVKVADQLPRDSAVNRFNTKVALVITGVVGSMWCAYAFALFDLISLPAAIRGGPSTIVSWVAQTFLQLVLLSIIMVGQNVQAAAADKRAEATFHDASATLHEVAHVQGHLAAQDELLSRIAAKIGLDPVPVIDNPELDETANPDPGC